MFFPKSDKIFFVESSNYVRGTKLTVPHLLRRLRTNFLDTMIGSHESLILLHFLFCGVSDVAKDIGSVEVRKVENCLRITCSLTSEAYHSRPPL